MLLTLVRNSSTVCGTSLNHNVLSNQQPARFIYSPEKGESMPPKNKSKSKLEKITNMIVPFLVLVLAIILILENPFWVIIDLEPYQVHLAIVDALIIFFFGLDLIFKWRRIHKIKPFIKLYWLDILAVFPFYLLFRAYGQLTAVFLAGEQITDVSQKAAHEYLALKEAELLKEEKLAREIKPIARLIRVCKARWFVTHHKLKKAGEK